MTQWLLDKTKTQNLHYVDFKRQVSKAGIFADIKTPRHYETPIEKRKRKAIARRKKNVTVKLIISLTQLHQDNFDSSQ